MTAVLQLRRGSAAETAAFTGANGEITYDTTDKRAVMHDGSTAGGIPLAKESEIPAALNAAFTAASASGAAALAFHEDTDNGTNKVTVQGPASVASDKVATLQDVTGTIYVSGGTDVALADGGTGASLSDPGADRVMFWDDSAGAVDWLAPGNGLTITTTTIAVDSASDTVDGIVELATDAETVTGTDTARAVTPSNLTGASIFGSLPQNSKSAAYTLVAADQSKHIFHPSADTSARTWTIPANASVAFAVGTTITFINQNGAGVITIAITSDTMRLAGAGTTGSRSLAANGIATAVKVTSTEWIISGTGLT